MGFLQPDPEKPPPQSWQKTTLGWAGGIILFVVVMAWWLLTGQLNP